MIRSRILWSVIWAGISLAGCYVYSGGDRVGWINSLFMIGLTLLLLAAIYTVVNGGFFSVFVKGFKQLSANSEPSRNVFSRLFGGRKEDYGFEDPLDGSGSEAAEKRREKIRAWLAAVCFGAGALDTAFSFLLLSFL
ncbi:uncharacterized protein DUF3899 [Melghirimyces profundicolus]|uniref:Uncharacterized protein DUF3899 n=1 Tax=Melghirimyces profundicolus TaxID=1242148 RepID=A0A2T6BSV2_9BACL|nr:DUF3899 domain-containing protein [Melghirimyces profundicolus]PTX59119.1 uncharacterized protein DUF3899 [Melghirimyces profundicolus]